MKRILPSANWSSWNEWIYRIALLAAMILSFAGCSEERPETDRRAITQLVAQIRETWEKGDIDAFLALGDEEMRFFTLDGRDLNREEALRFLQPMFRRWWDRHLAVDSLEIFTEGRLALVRYHGTFSFLSSGGRTELDHLVSMVLRKRGNAGWKILHFHMSAKQP